MHYPANLVRIHSLHALFRHRRLFPRPSPPMQQRSLPEHPKLLLLRARLFLDKG